VGLRRPMRLQIQDRNCSYGEADVNKIKKMETEILRNEKNRSQSE
jgi:hypothetical protein